MRRLLIVLPALLLLTSLALGGGFMVYDAGNGPAPVVAAPALDPEPLSAALPENKPLEAVQADKPDPEPEPAKETVVPAPEPAPELTADNPSTDPRLEAMRAEIAKALEQADLTEAEKKLQLEKLELALEAMQAQLGKAITIKGRVTDWAGQPVAGAKICAAITRDAAPAGGEKNETKRRRVSSTSMTAVLGTSDAQGCYTGTYQGVSEGPVELRLYAQAANYLPSPTQTLSATSGETYENIDFSLPQGAGISGRVVDQNFNPVAGARVFAMLGGNMDRRRSAIASYSAFTDEQGCFSIGGMAAGSYSISVQCTGYTMQEKAQSIDVVEGEPTPLAADIVMNTATGVKLKLTSASGTPKGYFTVNFFTADGKSVRGAGMADANGVALVVNVPENAVELQVTMRGFSVSERIRFSVYPGAHSDAGEVTLEPVEEQGKYDGKTPPPPGTGSLDEANRKLAELEKLREKLRRSEGK